MDNDPPTSQMGWFGQGPTGPPDNERPALSPLLVELASTPDVAVWLSRFTGYTEGLEFTMSVRLRVAQEGARAYAGPSLRTVGRRHNLQPLVMDEELLLGVEFADGRTAIDAPILRRHPGRPPGAREPDRPELAQLTASSSDLKSQHVMWLTPPPPDGRTTFVFAWRHASIPEIRHVVDETAFASLCRQARTLWKPPPPTTARPSVQPPPPEPLSVGWFGAHAHTDQDSWMS